MAEKKFQEQKEKERHSKVRGLTFHYLNITDTFFFLVCYHLSWGFCFFLFVFFKLLLFCTFVFSIPVLGGLYLNINTDSA